MANRIVDELIKACEQRELITVEASAQLQDKDIQSKNQLLTELKGRLRVNGDVLSQVVADQAGVPFLRLANFKPSEELTNLIPSQVLRTNQVYPISITEKTLTLAVVNPGDVSAQQRVKDLTDRTVIIVVTPIGDISDLLSGTDQSGNAMGSIIEDSYDSMVDLSQDTDQDIDIGTVLADSDSVPVVRIVNSILVEAQRKGVSDIHIEPFEEVLRLRYRCDGSLYEGPRPPKALQYAITSRLKVMANLDISERRIPQDGKFRCIIDGTNIDLRVSMLPTVYGEKIVLRILDKGNLKAGLDDLGLDPDSLQKLKLAVANPHGLVLVTGPTGSGKTTTLYSCLQELNTIDTNIITVENPVEYDCFGLNQVEINEKTGLTFAASLRSILRQDPDVVLVGETRDAETAAISVKAAMTGHLVFTTLHTNSAPGAITRLGDMGVEPFLLSSSVILSQAQRLVKTICKNCKEVIEVDKKLLEMHGIPVDAFDGKEIYHGAGCKECGGSGYRGRASIMEILLMTPKIRDMVLAGASSDELCAAAIVDQDFKDLRFAGLRRVVEGITTVEEVIRVTSGEH